MLVPVESFGGKSPVQARLSTLKDLKEFSDIHSLLSFSEIKLNSYSLKFLFWHPHLTTHAAGGGGRRQQMEI